MGSNSKQGAAVGKVASKSRKLWVKPEIIEIIAGSAEAIQRDGQPDGGPFGQSRS